MSQLTHTLYRRPLPAAQIPFASAQGKQLFAQALATGHMEGYFRLAQQFHTQAEPAYCGLGSLVVALNALDIDPGRLWRGPWRWYSEELLDCCVPLAQIQERGLTLEETACLARCNGTRATLYRPDEVASFERFEAHVLEACTQSDGPILIVSYDRAALGQTGHGHFSPIGGYHPQQQLVLLLDVARFKYPPHWIALRELYDAMLPIDEQTGRSRGWIKLERDARSSGLHYSLSCRSASWAQLEQALNEALPKTLRERAPTTLAQAAELAVTLVQAQGVELALRASLSEPHAEAYAALIKQLEATPAAPIAHALEADPQRAAALTLLLLLLPQRLPDDALPSPMLSQWRQWAEDAPSELSHELEALSEQLDHICAMASAGGGSSCCATR